MYELIKSWGDIFPVYQNHHDNHQQYYRDHYNWYLQKQIHTKYQRVFATNFIHFAAFYLPFCAFLDFKWFLCPNLPANFRNTFIYKNAFANVAAKFRLFSASFSLKPNRHMNSIAAYHPIYDSDDAHILVPSTMAS